MYSGANSHETNGVMVCDGTSSSQVTSSSDDPYAELESYLEKVKREINEAFELYTSENKKKETFVNKHHEASTNIDNVPPRERCSLDDFSSTKEKMSKNTADQLEDERTTEWADKILKDLHILMTTNEQSSLLCKKRNNLEKNSDECSKFKTQKHTYIPLQSFNLDNKFNEKKPPVAHIRKSQQRQARNDVKISRNTVLKIEEDGEFDKYSKESKTCDISKKGSTSTIWTSEESILRSNRFVGEDNKSCTSSECEDVQCGRKTRNSLENCKVESFCSETPSADLSANRRTLESGNNALSSRFAKFHSTSCADDPLEVLSQYDEVNDDHEDDFYSDDYTKPLDIEYIDCEDEPDFSSNARALSLDFCDVSNQSRDCEKSSCRSLPLVRRPAFYSYDKEHRQSKPRPFCLPLASEPFQTGRELPSPSSASLHSGSVSIQELSTKSSSAPILLKKETYKEDFGQQRPNLRCSRSQSDRYLAEIEAAEACKWLRAAGFPQYAQMYEDLQFPIDLSNVAKDHPFLENDPMQSLYRRLVALNKCATMRIDNNRKHPDNIPKDDSDDDGYALSENWTFTQKDRRWSRIGEMGIEITPAIRTTDKSDDDSRESSPDGSNEINLGFGTLPSSHQDDEDNEKMPVRFRRTGSERLKDGAKAFLRRVESIKSRRKKRQNRDGLIISGPQVFDLNQISQKMGELKCIDVVTMSTPPSPTHTTSPLLSHRSPTNNNDLTVTSEYADKLSPIRLSPHLFPRSAKESSQLPNSSRTSPLHFFSYNPNLVKDLKSGDDSSPYYSDASQESSSGGIKKKRPSRARRFLQRGSKVEDIGALSDSECHPSSRKLKYIKDGNFSSTEPAKVNKLARGGSLNLGKDSGRIRNSFKTRSFRSRSSIRKDKCSESDREDDSIVKPVARRPVVRYHSFQSTNQPEQIFKKCHTARTKSQPDGTPLASMSCGQLQVLRKLALVTLTGYMERYCPSHRSGWNWELPKFIKKIKSPDYKDKKVFGIPLILVLQRTGQTLPKPIQTSIKWLKLNAMDQVGLFRKSGVKSRIQKLRQIIESEETDLASIFDLQQAYDVADMLKQYFRDLPESLLTAKMSETFVAIFQHLPAEVQPDAIQCAGLLLPDENREVLQSLLDFLHHVSDNSMFNQMTANNLAVCLAPSLFHNTIATTRSSSVSPRRRKPTGIPDPRELSETRASHECLTHMIEHSKSIFTISKERVQRCNFGYMEESRPVPLENLGEDLQVHDWRGYVYECTSATIKEGREKSRGWISVSSVDQCVDVAYKKISDGHLLRLWRCTSEIDALPGEVLHYIINERHMWDVNLLKSRVIEQLDGQSQIYQYATGGQYITDYCILRSWRSDLPKGACVVIETSVDHPGANLLMGGVRGVVLASRYLIEPCGSDRSKLMHLGRVDFKGRTPEWYNKSYGHICSHYLTRIRNAFKRSADVVENKTVQ